MLTQQNESTIVTDNLKKIPHLRQRVSYLLFAYKGILITALMTIFFIGGIAFSFLTQKESVLSVRVLSKGESYENVVTELKTRYSDSLKLQSDQTVDILNLDLEEEKSQDVLVAQLAAHQIDVLFLSEEMDQEMTPLFQKNKIRRGDFSYEDQHGRRFIARIPGEIPNQAALEKIAKE